MNSLNYRNKIAYCFLIYSSVTHEKIWKNFFEKGDYKTYSIYSHIKKVTKDTPAWLKENAVKTGPTDWCGANLVTAYIKMLKAALKNKNNKFFCIISGSCIPLYNCKDTYKKITSINKGRYQIDRKAKVYLENKVYYASQWSIINRKIAREIVKLQSTEGKKFIKNFENNLKYSKYKSCPDETYPINWLIKKYGSPSSKKFKDNIKQQMTTYTKWKKDACSPLTLSGPYVKKNKKKICTSGSIFARKFTKNGAKEIAMKCRLRTSRKRKSKRTSRKRKSKRTSRKRKSKRTSRKRKSKRTSRKRKSKRTSRKRKSKRTSRKKR